jgi:hypothetical protein
MANLPFATIDSHARALGKPSMSQHDRDLVFDRRMKIYGSVRAVYLFAMELRSAEFGGTAFGQSFDAVEAAHQAASQAR